MIVKLRCHVATQYHGYATEKKLNKKILDDVSQIKQDWHETHLIIK